MAGGRCGWSCRQGTPSRAWRESRLPWSLRASRRPTCPVSNQPPCSGLPLPCPACMRCASLPMGLHVYQSMFLMTSGSSIHHHVLLYVDMRLSLQCSRLLNGRCYGFPGGPAAKMRGFEACWEAGAPLLGEPRARGWGAWHQRRLAGLPPEDEDDHAGAPLPPPEPGEPHGLVMPCGVEHQKCERQCRYA